MRMNLTNALLLPDERMLKRLVKLLCKDAYSLNTYRYIKAISKRIRNLFKGKFRGYSACNTQYHDYSHTISATIAVCRLIDGRFISGKPIAELIARDCIVATFFHDVGYIQKETDTDGTGAKYTLSHVSRSVEFVQNYFQEFGIEKSSVDRICRLIQCTGLSVNLNKVPFEADDERLAGTILGTADLMGQMADREYLEKLLFLYYEFREAGISGYDTEFDIIKKTARFYEIAKSRLEREFGSVYKYAREHFLLRAGINRNEYIDSIERNMAYLQKIIEDDTSNFRHKLRRGKWVHLINEDNYTTVTR